MDLCSDEVSFSWDRQNSLSLPIRRIHIQMILSQYLCGVTTVSLWYKQFLNDLAADLSQKVLGKGQWLAFALSFPLKLPAN